MAEYPYVTELSVADVLFGRGSGPNDHPGNIKFREYVAERKTAYMATSHRLTKTNLAKEILNLVSASGGRFLRKMEVPPPHLLSEGTDVYEVVDDHTIMEKAKQALRQNAGKAKDVQPVAVTATTAPPVLSDQDFDLEPIPFTKTGYTGPPPTIRNSIGTNQLHQQQQQQQQQQQIQHQTPITGNRTVYDIPHYHPMQHLVQPLRPDLVSGYGKSPSPPFASYNNTSSNPDADVESFYAGRSKIISSTSITTSDDEVMDSYTKDERQRQQQDDNTESSSADDGGEGGGENSSSRSPRHIHVRSNSLRMSLTIDQVFAPPSLDPKQLYHRTAATNNTTTTMSDTHPGRTDMNELSESFGNMMMGTENSIKYQNTMMASAETIGTIDQMESVADMMSFNSSTLSIFDKPPGGGSGTVPDSTIPARHTTYLQSELVHPPLDNNPSDGLVESGTMTTPSSGTSRQGSSSSTTRLSRSSKQSADSTNSSMSFDGLFDLSRNKSSSGFDSMFSGVRKQVEQEYPSWTVPKIPEESADDGYLPIGQSSIDMIQVLEDSDQHHSITPPPPATANDQRQYYYEQDTEN